MPEQIISASGTQYGLIVNPDGSINVISSGLSSSPAAGVGSTFIFETNPNANNQNNPLFSFVYIVSGTATGVTGSQIGSIIQHIDAGSFVQVLTWSNNKIVTVGSWA